MTRSDRTDADEPTGSDAEVPTGSDADEMQDRTQVEADASAAADDVTLSEAGLPQEGGAAPAKNGRGFGGLGHRLYNGEAGLDVLGRSRLIYRVTAVVVLLCIAAIAFRGFNFGIDFAGGNSLRLPGGEAILEEVRVAAEDAGADVATAQIVGGDTVLLRTGALDNATERAVVEAVAEAAGIQPEQVSPASVSADWGQDITDQALIALAVFLVAVVVFLALRFQPKMAVGAMAALVHDIVLTAGVYALVGFEVTPSTVIGFLTILGFSLYDTVVVFDKVDENTRDLERTGRMTWTEAANLAVNQTLMRSINTSVIALLPVAGLLFVGAGLLGVGTLKDLALVLFVGLAAGTYSSIFLATPIVADLKNREPEVQALRRRVQARRASVARQGGGAGVAGGTVSTARRSRSASAQRSSVGLAEREEDLPDPVEADVVVESPASVRRDPAADGGTRAPRPGQKPQRPGNRRSGGSKRR